MHLQTCSIYIVGKMEGESIAELSHLNLRGELNIKCLENVRDEKEAKMANLEKKQHLHMLGLLWGGNEGLSKMSAEGRNLPEVKDIKNRHSTEPSHRYYGGAGGGGSGEVEAILEGLKPHRNLQKLFIKGYNGVKFPLWFLPNLTAMVLINCKSCVYLPTLGQLPCLKTLYLQGLSKVKLISREFYADDIQKPFPSLKELTIRDFPNLDEWFGIEDKEPFVCLEKLHINNCPNLKAAPFFPSLHHLELRGCHPSIVNSLEKVSTLSILVIDSFPDMVLSGELLRNNHFLTSLKISSCPNIRSLPLQLENLTALKSLTISWCEELSSLPQGLQNFKSLESLVISECHGLTSLPEDGIGGLSSLKVLSIENCNNLTSLSNGLQNLIALEHLTIMYCPKLVSLPNNFSNLLALRSLSILCCPELVSLPEGLQHVTALHSLELRSCPALKELPDWNIYSSLRSLSLSDCQNLTSLPEELLREDGLASLQSTSDHENWGNKSRQLYSC
ncbi:Disease resistance protein [Quillaja saponaria]|uniref:Disease resistance protein n=1 Tax=Quillaja saponaria TaxID=32244 RepID=A0AAD7PVH0_QUISA|nr:Disease resistance protein [Quillaja saponaria]